MELSDKLKGMLRTSRLYGIVEHVRQGREFRHWKRRGGIGPAPHLIKQAAIKEYAYKFGLSTLIETGTYLGSMVNAMKSCFGRIISIELDQTLYEMACRRFADYEYITILQGDSADVISQVLRDVTEPCLFWLDGHYSGGITAKGAAETPIVQEIKEILRHPVVGHVILIDDAREFIGERDYPTIAELRKMIHDVRPDWELYVTNDIIRIHPPE